jgi:transcriptional regulator with XRE-family HTH domain
VSAKGEDSNEMGKQTMSGQEVLRRLRARRLTQFDLAREAGIPQPTISQVLAGWLPLTAERKARLEAAIMSLGLAEPLPPNAHEPIFELETADSN